MTKQSVISGLPFMKMHGLGNDFVVIDSRGRGAVATAALARALGDRNRGVGFDQLAEIRDANDADITLDFWNSDGTRAGACGNATRCVADHVMRRAGQGSITIRTARGTLQARRRADARRHPPMSGRRHHADARRPPRIMATPSVDIALHNRAAGAAGG